MEEEEDVEEDEETEETESADTGVCAGITMPVIRSSVMPESMCMGSDKPMECDW